MAGLARCSLSTAQGPSRRGGGHGDAGLGGTGQVAARIGGRKPLSSRLLRRAAGVLAQGKDTLANANRLARFGTMLRGCGDVADGKCGMRQRFGWESTKIIARPLPREANHTNPCRHPRQSPAFATAPPQHPHLSVMVDHR